MLKENITEMLFLCLDSLHTKSRVKIYFCMYKYMLKYIFQQISTRSNESEVQGWLRKEWPSASGLTMAKWKVTVFPQWLDYPFIMRSDQDFKWSSSSPCPLCNLDDYRCPIHFTILGNSLLTVRKVKIMSRSWSRSSSNPAVSLVSNVINHRWPPCLADTITDSWAELNLPLDPLLNVRTCVLYVLALKNT